MTSKFYQAPRYSAEQIRVLAAFAQAEMPKETPVYVKPPPGYMGQSQEVVLKLLRSLYGTEEAAKLWYDKLKDGLLARGFKKSNVDPCLFISPKDICVIYVDDCLYFSRKKSYINEVLKSFEHNVDEHN